MKQKLKFDDKNHFEVKKSNLPVGGSKYSKGDNAAELEQKAKGLADYAKKNTPKNG